MQEQHTNSFDEGFGAWLRKSANPISRRSLLGRSIQFLLGGAGLAGLGSIALLVDVPGWGRRPEAQGKPTFVPPVNGLGHVAPPAGFDASCSNLHGRTCQGNCDPTAAGSGASGCLLSDTTRRQASWVGCCKTTDTGKYQCYTLADVVCTKRPTHWNKNCPGNVPAGRVWFGGNQGRRSYVCTVPAAVGAAYGTAAQCAANCTPKQYPNAWAC